MTERNFQFKSIMVHSYICKTQQSVQNLSLALHLQRKLNRSSEVLTFTLLPEYNATLIADTSTRSSCKGLTKANLYSWPWISLLKIHSLTGLIAEHLCWWPSCLKWITFTLDTLFLHYRTKTLKYIYAYIKRQKTKPFPLWLNVTVVL